MGTMFKAFRIPLALTLITLVLMLFLAGPSTTLTVAVLAILEISLSFDNAVVNAKILGRMSRYWQGLFLTLGIAIAVFGMRLIFPLVIVSLAGHLGPVEVVQLAINEPDKYAEVLIRAHPAISAFGGMFLLMLFLDFVFEDRKIKWLRRLEWALAKIGRLENLTVITALFVLAFTATTFGREHAESVLLAGVCGIGAYLLITSLTSLFDVDNIVKTKLLDKKTAKTWVSAGLFSFIYLEVLDGSFSFDAVVGAFAISNQIFVIALGLGIGALFVRALTVYLVREGTMARYIYLEHGAHYAVGVLALILLATIHYEIPQLVTGLIGIGFIGVAFIDSRKYLKRLAQAELKA